MKLYFSRDANSLAAHLTLIECGLPFEAERIEAGGKKTASGADFLTINPKGCVPALQLENGQVLTELAAIVQYVADQAPATNLAPPLGSMERYRLMEWLAYIGTKLYPWCTNVTSPAAVTPEVRAQVEERHFAFLEKTLADRHFLTGDTFTVADACLFAVLERARRLGLPVDKHPALSAFVDRVGQRQTARTAMTSEGLLPL